MCSCGSEPETTAHFLLRCQNHVISRSKLLKNVYNLQTFAKYILNLLGFTENLDLKYKFSIAF